MLRHVKDFSCKDSKYGKSIIFFYIFICDYRAGQSNYFFPEKDKNTKHLYHSFGLFLCQSCLKCILHLPSFICAVNIFILGKFCTCLSCLAPTGRALAKAFLTDNRELASIVTERHGLQPVTFELLLHLLYALSSLELSKSGRLQLPSAYDSEAQLMFSCCISFIFPAFL